MLKKLFIAAFVLLLLVGIVAAIAGFNLNQTYGWLPSSVISHDTVATADTRLRLVVDSARLGEALKPYYPAESPLPSWVPGDLGSLVPRLLPREIALLGNANFRDTAYQLTLFVNEQRGGAFLPDFLNNQTNFKESTAAVQWTDPGFTLEERGKLQAHGTLPMPENLESTIMESWPSDAPSDSLTIHGGHLAEGVIDNRGGEVVALIATCAPLWGASLEMLQANPQFNAALDLLTQVSDIRLAIDLKNPDTMLIQLLIHGDPAVRGRLEFIGPFVAPMLAAELKRSYQLTMETTYAWLDDESTYKIDMNITGIEARLKEVFQGMATAAPAPEAPRAAR